MKIFVTVKQLGKRKDFLTKKELILPHTPTNLKALLKAIITINVYNFNNKTEENIINFLTDVEIETQVQSGKVGFDRRYHTEKADLQKAIETAYIAYTDGLFRVFQGDNELTNLDEPIQVNEEDVFTFIRFTMLSGRMW